MKKRAFFDWRYISRESRRAYNWAFILFWSVLLTVLIQRFVIGVGIITDISMQPTLREGDTFLVNKYIYYFIPPHRGEIVVIRKHPMNPELYVKRIVGLPGETLEISGGAVYVNGKKLEEPYAAGATFPDLGPLHLGKDAYFVLGDNRLQSEDSRQFGTASRRQLQGKIKPGELFPIQ